jgi:hypothetical protein
VSGRPASASTAPGAYANAITCAGASDSDYAITYGAGNLTVDPVIRLDAIGLPTTVAKQATLDGRKVALPTGEVEVGFGTAHSFSFPGVVTTSTGVLYLTLTPGFIGPVGANLTTTATYTTMAAVLTSAVTSGGVDKTTAVSLNNSWNTVQADLKAGQTSQALSTMRSFAGLVSAQSGKKIKAPTATVLLAYAQTAYTFAGGTGVV